MEVPLWFVVVLAIGIFVGAFLGGMRWSLYREKPVQDHKVKEVVGAYRLALECALQDLIDAKVIKFGDTSGRLLLSEDRFLHLRPMKNQAHRRSRLRLMSNPVLIRVDDGTVYRDRDSWEDWRDPRTPTPTAAASDTVTERVPERHNPSSS